MNLYKKCKDIPNPSPGLLKLFRKHPNRRIWGYKDHSKASRAVTLKKLKSLKLNELSLIIGCPHIHKKMKDGTSSVKSRGYTGTRILRHMFTGPKTGDVCVLGLGSKGKPVWFIDITERVVQELNSVGACALSKEHCVFKEVSPRVRKCEYCGRKQKKRVKITRRETWVNV